MEHIKNKESEKEKREFLIEVKEYIVDLIKDGFLYTIMAIPWIIGAIMLGMALYCLYFIRDEIIKFFLCLLLTVIVMIGICILFAVIALIKRFFDFILNKIEKSAEINNEQNISSRKEKE